jgi:hypothetical protein
MSRVMSRDAAMKVATDGLKLVTGAGGDSPAGFVDTLHLNDIVDAQKGAIEDMDTVADVIYDRDS